MDNKVQLIINGDTGQEIRTHVTEFFGPISGGQTPPPPSTGGGDTGGTPTPTPTPTPVPIPQPPTNPFIYKTLTLADATIPIVDGVYPTQKAGEIILGEGPRELAFAIGVGALDWLGRPPVPTMTTGVWIEDQNGRHHIADHIVTTGWGYQDPTPAQQVLLRGSWGDVTKVDFINQGWVDYHEFVNLTFDGNPLWRGADLFAGGGSGSAGISSYRFTINPITATPPPPVGTDPGTATGPEPSPFQLAILTPGGTYNVPEGIAACARHVGFDQSIIGAGMRKSILDGLGGIGSGHRLAWGKGILHFARDAGLGPMSILIRDLGFTNGGGADGASDGEAALYFENFEGLAHVLRCAFDGGENGIFTPTNFNGSLVDLVVEACVFGRNRAIGLPDGSSHNAYIGTRSVTVKNSILLPSNGNQWKIRGPKGDFIGNYNRRNGGRFLDLPGGAVVNSSGHIYITEPGAISNNAFGFYDENSDNANPGVAGSFTSVDDSFYFGGREQEMIWINNPNFRVEFIRPKVFWFGSKAPVVNIAGVGMQGPGQLAGDNPFLVFDDSNHVDGPPPIPADPVA